MARGPKFDCMTCGTRHRAGECPMVGDSRCAKCGGKMDPKKERGGHSGTCTAWLSEQALAQPRNKARQPVKFPQHRGPWSRPGGAYTNEMGLRVRDYTCKTCGRTATTLANAGEPTNWCPEVRGS